MVYYEMYRELLKKKKKEKKEKRLLSTQEKPFFSNILAILLPADFYLMQDLIWFDFLCLTPLSAIFQLYHGDQF